MLENQVLLKLEGKSRK